MTHFARGRSERRAFRTEAWSAAILVVALVAGPVPDIASADGGPWATTGSLLTGRAGLQAEAVGGAVYALGGTTGGCPQPPALASEAYDPDANTWSPKATLTAPPGNGGQRTEFATAVLNGKIFAFGGGNCLTFFADVQVYDPATDSWSARHPMPTARVYGVAAAVNGKIYLIGGLIGDPGPIAPTLEYDPATETWITKAPMPTDRIRPGAAVIDGKIYVVGGATTTGVPVDTVEAYDPATDRWTPLAPMSTARSKPAVGNVNGLLYAFGGVNSSFVIVASGEMYDTALDMWFDAPPLPAARVGAGAAVLEGVLYVIGGQSATVTGNATTFAFTPSGSGSWSATGSLAQRRFLFGGAIALPDRRVLVAGGFNYQQGTLASAELYDPATGTWSAASSMGTARRGHGSVRLPNGKVLVAGGLVSSAELYDPTTDTWSATGSMSVSRYLPTATLLPNGKVLVAGGYDASFTPTTTAELYDPATGTWSMTGSMATGRTLHAATLLRNGKVLVTGGWNGGPISSAELYDLATGTWSATASMTITRDSHTAILLPDGTVLVAGGETSGGIGVASAGIYSPDTGLWSTTSSMTSPRAGHTATLVPGGRVLVAGGLSRNAVGAELATAELYDAATATWSATGSMANARYAHGAALLHSGKVLVAAGNGFNDSPLASAELYEPTAPSPPPLAADTTPPVVTVPASLLLEATSAAGAVGTFQASANDDVDGPLPVTCNPASGSTFPLGTTTVTCTATDAAGNSGSASFIVTVLSPSQMIANLISTVATSFPQATNLLQSALNNLTAGQAGAACNQIAAFINQVQAQSGKKLTTPQAVQLIAAANRIRAALGCR